MDVKKIESLAAKMAKEARPGTLKHGGVLYTLVFNQNEWHYDVFEDGFLLMRINEKRISKAKKFLKFWLEN